MDLATCFKDVKNGWYGQWKWTGKMTNLLIFLAAAAFLAVVVPRYGADTRDSRDWKAVEPFPPECDAAPVIPVVTGREAGRVLIRPASPPRRTGTVGVSGPRGRVGIHRS